MQIEFTTEYHANTAQRGCRSESLKGRGGKDVNLAHLEIGTPLVRVHVTGNAYNYRQIRGISQNVK